MREFAITPNLENKATILQLPYQTIISHMTLGMGPGAIKPTDARTSSEMLHLNTHQIYHSITWNYVGQVGRRIYEVVNKLITRIWIWWKICYNSNNICKSSNGLLANYPDHYSIIRRVHLYTEWRVCQFGRCWFINISLNLLCNLDAASLDIYDVI